MAILSFVLVLSTAHLAANFYNEPRLSSIVSFAAISIILTPFYIINFKQLEKKLDFKTISKINLSGTFLGMLAAIVGAYVGLGVYALILQALMTTVVRLLFTLLVNKWTPSIYFNFSEIKEMVWYSLKFKASDMAYYFERNVDYLILGKFFNSVTLGYYAFAYNIMYTPVKRISYVFSDVLFPSFSSFKDDKEKIMKGYFKSVQLIAMVSIPAMSIIAFNAEIVIQTVFGEKWNAAIPIVRILCFAGAVQSISQFGGVVFSSIRKPEIGLYISIGKTILTVLAIVIGIQFGVLWVAYLLLLAKILSYLLFLIVLNKQISFSFMKLVGSLSSSIIILLTLSIIYTAAYMNLLNLNAWLLLGLMISISIALSYMFQKKLIMEMIRIIFKK